MKHILNDMAQGKCALKNPDWNEPQRTLRRLWYKLEVNGVIDQLGEATCQAYLADIASSQGVSAPTMSYNTNTNHIDLRQWVDDAKPITKYEYAAPCPKCGGKDRFHLKLGSNGWRCFCRQCTGVDGLWMDAIEFLRWRDGIDFVTACERLRLPPDALIKRIDKRNTSNHSAKGNYALLADIADLCARSLDNDTIAYLQTRGISEHTARENCLGLSLGGDICGVYVSPGITIPCKKDRSVFYIKIRTSNGYRQVKGGTPALYVARKQGRNAIVVETELDALMLAERCEQLSAPIAVYATGSVSWNLDAASRLRLRHTVYTAFDNDDAGRKATDKWGQPPLRYEGKDVGEVYEREGWKGIDQLLNQVAPVEDSYVDRLLEDAQLGAVVAAKLERRNDNTYYFDGDDAELYKDLVRSLMRESDNPFSVIHKWQGKEAKMQYANPRH